MRERPGDRGRWGAREPGCERDGRGTEGAREDDRGAEAPPDGHSGRRGSVLLPRRDAPRRGIGDGRAGDPAGAEILDHQRASVGEVDGRQRPERPGEQRRA